MNGDVVSAAESLTTLYGWSLVVIGLAYTAIAATLLIAVYRSRREVPYPRVLMAFGVFIAICGASHIAELWTARSTGPSIWMAEGMKILTAAVSLATAIILPPLIPKMIDLLRSARESAARRDELEKAYQELNDLYRKATQPAPRKESITAIIEMAHLQHGPKQLAEMARKVSEHARELERAKHAAEAANRAKDQFLAVLSHELRTPLTPALAAASNLESATNIGHDELRDSLALIRRNIELEARLVDDLLDLTRISKGKLRIHVSTIDLHETIRHAIQMCQSDANHKRADIEYDLAAEDRYIRGDGARLAQVFWNIILNAIKFTPADGVIRVRTANPAPGRVRVDITDTGIGIDADHLSRIFEPFQQGEESTTRRYGGLGLGLSVAKGLVDAHGGTIAAASDGKDSGSTFTIELETTVPPSAPAVTAPAIPEPRQEKLRVLVVEDHADTRTALERILTRWGHEIRIASTATEAEEIAKSFLPELLLSDIGLPDATGIELLGRIRSNHDLLAIAMSGYGMEADLEHTRNAGFMDHLIKPVSTERLKESIDNLLRRNDREAV